ncbi:MAG: hypothetical protein ABJN36_17245 [Cyclobacteriaceae bacterium]
MQKNIISLSLVFLVGCQQLSEYNYIEEYPDGQTRIEANYTNGIKNGKYREFYENGSIKYESNFKSGTQTDTTKYYSENGQIQFIQIWDRGIPLELFEFQSKNELKRIAGSQDFFDKNLIIHNNLSELNPRLELLDDSLREDTLNIRVIVPNSIRPHSLKLTKGRLKAMDNYGHVLITEFDINETTVLVGIMSNGGMLQLPEVPLSSIK